MTKAILRTIPIMQSTALAAEGHKFFKKKKKGVGDFMGHTAKTIVGVELTKETANVIESF